MTPVPFDLQGPLPEGVVVLEASAGTGKTYAIAALVARYVAAGVPLQELLIVTFTRMATGELRERVRDRLVTVAGRLERVLDGTGDAGGDEVVELLAAGDPAEAHEACRRLRAALTDFDAATISTTHGFCEEALSSLGIEADVDRHATFAEQLGDLADEVVDDLYLRKFTQEEAPPISRGQAGMIARQVVGNPRAPLQPAEDAAGTPGMRARLAVAVRRELERRKRRLAVLTYDDFLTRLDTTLQGSEHAVQRLRDRFRIVLIDEFQDTDPVQWDIMARAFDHAGGTLVLIGDPKQAVYAFRGADVYAYLTAVRAAGRQATLDVNHRSDEAYVQACDRLFDGARLGEQEIVHRPVHASANHHGRRLHGAPVDAPLRFRVLDRRDVNATGSGKAEAPSARAHVAADLAGDVVALLRSDATIEVRAADGTATGTEAVHPGHVAVLVRTNAAAAEIQDALAGAGVPAVIAGAGSVFRTPAATAWLRLLEALERPSATGVTHTAALTPFVGWDAARVAAASDAEWEVVHGRLHRWARVLRERGVAALMETMTLTGRLPERLLRRERGERELTDLRHLAQLLHEQAATESLGVTALALWLRRRIADAGEEDDVERARRLESDARAVQIMTVHRAKGLEFPIVYLPSLWDGGRGTPKAPEPVPFHDAAAGQVRTIDVGLEGPEYEAHRDQALAESRGEDLRLAYVALTRARHQAVVWWAGSYYSSQSALSRLVFDRRPDGTIPSVGGRVPEDQQAFDRFRAVAEEALVSVEWARVQPGHYSPPLTAAATLRTAAFARTLDHDWRRTSFSDLTAGTYEARVGSEPEEAGVGDEPNAPGAPPLPGGDDDADLRERPAALTAMPAGTRVGTAVHAVLEATDYAAADLDAELALRLDTVPGTDALGDRALVAAGLRGVLETPLGPLVGGARLRDVARADRLDELQFELPLLGAERPTGALDLADVGALVRDTLPADDPLAAYAERLADPALRRGVRGYVTGSIDLVLRRHTPAGPSFVVVDFKTNWLAAPDEPLTAWHHRPAALRAEMVHHHYALQALLYSAALHRYLRWRLRGYDPATHLGGVLYLFLRGMTGADTPTVDGVPCGVLSWRPPAALVTGLSDLLDRG